MAKLELWEGWGNILNTTTYYVLYTYMSKDLKHKPYVFMVFLFKLIYICYFVIVDF